MPSGEGWTRDEALKAINEAREKWNEELNVDWTGRKHREAEEREEQERQNERIREGREHHDDELRLRRVLDRLADVLERLAKLLEGGGVGGTKLSFRLIKQGGNMATVNIVSIQRLSGVVGVLTDAPHGLNTGDSATIAGVSDASFNGTATGVTVTSPTNFTFNQAGADTAAPLTGGTVSSVGTGSGGGTGTVGTPSAYAITVQDQTGATQPLPAGVTPSASVTGGDGSATASVSADNATLTINYKTAGTYTTTVSDSTGKVQSASVTETVTGGTTSTLQFVLTKNAAAAPAAALRRG